MERNDEPGVKDLLAALRRRRKAALIAFAAGTVVTVLLALLWPPTFRSTGTILIEQQEVPTDLVRSTVSSYADQRIQVISQRVMTTQNLLQIIQRYDLYPRERKRESREQLMERMRDDIGVDMISADVIDPRSGLPRAATIAFAVSFASRVPEKAMRVANELTSLFLNENITERTRLAGDAAQFLDGEAERLSKEITQLEGRLAEFKSRHVEALPELQSLNLQMLDRAEQEMRQIDTRRMSLDQQRVLLEAQLAQLKPYSVIMTETGERILSPTDRLKMQRSQLASLTALYGEEHPDVVRVRREIAGLEAEVGQALPSNDLARQRQQLLGELAAARERYSDAHPDVLRIQRQLDSIEASAERANREPTHALASENADNPAWIQLKGQLDATISDQRALDEQLRRLRLRIADHERKISASPGVEREYRELSRDYDGAQLKYREVRSKQMEAQLASNLESGRKGERFTMIEPPMLPEDPVSPNRLAVLIVGLALSLCIAGAIVALLESLDATVRGRRDLLDALGQPPLALIPHIATHEESLAGIRYSRAGLLTAAAAALGATLAIHFLYRPLDILWLTVMRRMGLY